MRYRVTLYCPDRGLLHDGRTMDERGVGGGITARLALVEALARQGHEVTACVHAPEAGHIRGVRYLPLADVRQIDTDILIAISTGGERTFAPLRDLDVRARLRMLWVQGVPEPDDVEAVGADAVCAASNFLRDVVRDRWRAAPSRVVVIYNGLRDELAPAASARRDPYAIAYIGPPEKGLDAAVGVLDRLREQDARYRLEVFGGAALWGADDASERDRPGVVWHGLLGQRDLMTRLVGCEYTLAMQAIEEGFGIGVQEARQAGNIVVASPVGAFRELIRDGYDGFLIPGAHDHTDAQDDAARLILNLAYDPGRRQRLRARAQQVPWSWDLAARAWAEYWADALGDASAPRVTVPGRPEVIALADGLHDQENGDYCPTVYPASPMHERFGVTDRVLIGGYYGYGNLGDEAILEAILESLRRTRPNLTATVASGDPDDTRRRHHVNAVANRDLPALVAAAEGSDLIILGGGGLFHDYQGTDPATTLTRWHWGLTYCEAFPLLAEMFGKPFQILGVGVGPLHTDDGKARTRLIVDRADAASVRDEASLAVLRSIGARTDHVDVAADPAFLVSTAGEADAPGERRAGALVAVAVREWTADDSAGWPRALAGGLDALIRETGATVLFVPFQAPAADSTTDDVRTAADLRALMEEQTHTVVCPAPFGAAETQAVLARADLVVALRLHAVILSAAAGVPVVAIDYDPKVAAAMHELGLDAHVLPIASLRADDVAARLHDAWVSRDRLRETIASRLPAIRARAAAGLRRTDDLLGLRPYPGHAPIPELSARLLEVLRRNTVRAEVADRRAAQLEAEAGRSVAMGGAGATAPPESAGDETALLAQKNREIWRLIRELAARPASVPSGTPDGSDPDGGAALAAATARLADREAELSIIHGSRAWRAITAYRQTRHAIGRLWRRPAHAFRAAARRVLPAPARTRLRQAAARRVQTPYAFVFDRYRRARAARAGADLADVRAPGRRGLVSVVLPAYNGASMIEGAVASVLGQTHDDLELIIVNDGSTDETGRMADEFAARDPRVRVIHQANQKLPAALSRGFREARGEFLTWTSCDNRLKPDFVERLVDCLGRHPDWDMAYANIDIIGEDGSPLLDSDQYESYQRPHGSEHIHLPDDTSELNVWANNYVGAAFMYRSRVATLLGDYSRHRFVSEDYDYWMRVNGLMVLRHADFDDPIYEYRFHGTSLTSRWAELRMRENRERLMVFEDFRRDFNLTPLAWRIDGHGPAARDLTQQVRDAGDIVLPDDDALTRLPPVFVPVVRVTVSDAPAASQPPATRDPASALHVLLSTGGVPGTVDAGWDLCVALDRLSEPPPLTPPQRGWLAAPSVASLRHAIDVYARSRHLAAIEQLVEAPPEPALDASVIICTHRTGDRVINAIVSALQQTHPADRYEVIVVDNDPADGRVAAEVTRLRDEHRANQPDQLRYVACPIRGLSAARNAGLACARGEVICFIDDDAVADPDWLSAVIAAFESRADLGVVGGRISLQLPEPRPIAVRPGWEKYWSHFEPGHERLTEVQHWWEFPWGANWSARRAALLQAGGFRSQYGRTGDNFWGGEELVAAATIRRLGWAVAVEPAARVAHDVDPSRFTFAHVLRTLVAGHQVTYLAQRDLYVPMESTLPRTIREFFTHHHDRDLPRGRGRWRNMAYRKLAQLRLASAQLRDLRLRMRAPVVAPRERNG